MTKAQPKKSAATPQAKGISSAQQRYGLSMALFNSDPELRGLLTNAVAGSWTPAKFQIELQNTKWFKSHSDTWRQMDALKMSDPASFQANLQQSLISVQNIAAQYGAHDVDLHGLAEQALMLGWNSDQVRNAIANHVTPNQSGDYGGDLSTISQNIRNVAFNNGVMLSDQQVQEWMQNIARGTASADQYQQSIRNIAAQTFPAYGDAIRGGMNLKDVAAPYVQSMASILEMNPGSITMTDPTIRKALSFQDDKGNNVPMSISSFEQSLRQDPRWQFTKGAQDAARGLGAALSNMWGRS